MKKVGERRLKEIMEFTKENIKDVDISTIVFKVPGGENAVDKKLVDFLKGEAPEGVTFKFEDTFNIPPSSLSDLKLAQNRAIA